MILYAIKNNSRFPNLYWFLKTGGGEEAEVNPVTIAKLGHFSVFL